MALVQKYVEIRVKIRRNTVPQKSVFILVFVRSRKVIFVRRPMLSMFLQLF